MGEKQQYRFGFTGLVACCLLFFATGCAAYPAGLASAEEMGMSSDSLQELRFEWMLADTNPEPRAVVVVTHGFNIDPEAMTEIEEALRSAGMDVLSLDLSGHESQLDEDGRLVQFREANFPIWREDIDQAVYMAGQRAGELDVPLYLVGFSLGGLLSVDYLNRHPDAAVERMVLLAPALALRWTSYLLMPLTALPNFFLPSVAPVDYRANNYAPVSAYESLYEGLRGFLDEVEPAHINRPAQVWLTDSDELVSPDGVRDFINEHGLNQWSVRGISKSSGAAMILNHLIIDANALGEESWEFMRQELLSFLLADGENSLP